MEQTEMTDLLYDLHLADAYSNTIPQDTSVDQRTQYFHSVFEKYGIDSAIFRRNLEYYSANPTQLQNMYAEISKRYRALEEVFLREREEKDRIQLRADSVKRAHYRDSVKRLALDSLRYKRVQYLIYWKHPDSTHLRPPAWNVDTLMQDWMRVFYADSAWRMQPVVPKQEAAEADTDETEDNTESDPS